MTGGHLRRVAPHLTVHPGRRARAELARRAVGRPTPPRPANPSLGPGRELPRPGEPTVDLLEERANPAWAGPIRSWRRRR